MYHLNGSVWSEIVAWAIIAGLGLGAVCALVILLAMARGRR